ncbi:MAG: 16S rRNA (uracil(1498)-N(3))-methyltransferase [Bdellovibrionaceae bacterium]|nr:16S rRNA (uracil(1498)-N(3))-methyltransferase [Pseudobdellovibrionaceae bacterium]
MRRYSLEEKHLNLLEKLIILEEQNFHHICEVCRNKKGSKFEVLIKSKAYLVEITNIFKKKATAVILEEREIVALKKPFLHLVLSMPKFSVFESILEKSVEMGISEIHLLSTTNSFVKSASKISVGKYHRWQKIMSGAMSQSARSSPLIIHPLSSREEVVSRLKQQAIPGIVAYVNATKTFSSVISPLKTPVQESLAMYIGSEGGFTQQDINFFRSQNILDFSLGEQVLKVETACLFLISLVKYQLQGL